MTKKTLKFERKKRGGWRVVVRLVGQQPALTQKLRKKEEKKSKSQKKFK